MSRAPTVPQLAAQLDALTRKVAQLERPRARRAPAAAPPGDDLLALIERRNPAGARRRGGRSGAIVYGGAVTTAGGQALWGIERSIDAVVEADPARVAEVLAVFGNVHRVRILLALIDGPRTAAELRRVVGGRSPGPMYHHLRDLLALGVVVQVDRRYCVPARHVVPILAAITLALDLGATRPA
ncbi:MAG: winged helix-turn-helix transcriptional regulator [Myxococcales bacterium]|nr:winged helix-turn-helix transcriptional regulator [Myxococcales bacterium]